MLKRISVIFVLFVIYINLNSYDLYELSYKLKNNEIEIEIFISQKYVDPEEYLKSINNKNKSLLSDGNMISESTVFVDSFYVKWPDKIVNVPTEFFEDCDDLHLNFTQLVVLSENNKSILLKLRGSDGGGSYTVYYIINKNGEVRRFADLYEYQFKNKIESNLKKIEKANF